MASAQATASK
jgi:uncharacterized membrane protein YgcG